MVGKRGQFYLLTAVILCTILIGIATIANYVNVSNTDTGIYAAKDSLQIEGAKTTDYGTNQGFTDAQMQTLMTNFTENYINYTLQGNGYFIFGTQSNIRLVAFQKDSETVSFDSGSGYSSLAVVQDKTFTQDFTPTNNTVNIKINGFQYNFVLSKGENFYFVLSQKDNGGKYIVTG